MVLGGSTYLHTQYRGLSLGILHHLQEAKPRESWNLLRTITYWLHFMQQLTLDPATGRYDFPVNDPTGASEFERGRLAFHRGDFDGAIHHLEASVKRWGASEERLFWLAMAHLRRAEGSNCLDAPPEPGTAVRCSLPLRRPHDRAADARRAAHLFEDLLERHGSGDPLHRWLFAFSAMAAGDYPRAVPDSLRPGTAFTDLFDGETARQTRRRHSHLRFEERAADLGLDVHNAGRGVAVEDFDGDGSLDIVTGGSFEGLRFFANLSDAHGTRRFEDRTVAAGLGGVTQPHILTAADYDNDGWMDLFVSRPFHHYVLLRNRGHGHFEDVTRRTGLLDPLPPGGVAATWVSAWGDVDLDGDLDLFLAQWAFRLPFVRGLMARPRMDSTLFINHGGRFVDRTEAWGLGPATRDQYFVGATFGDVDGDGFPDLFLSSPLPRTSALFSNREGRSFERSEALPVGPPGFVAAFVDVDHDGRLDLFQGGFGDARTSTAQAVFGHHPHIRSTHSRLFAQTVDGTFEVQPEPVGGLPMGTMGASYGDLDNDGCHDFYLGTGNPEGWFNLPNLMARGLPDARRCTLRTENLSMLEGFGTIQKGHGIVFFDFDGDGDQDIYSSLGGMWPADRWPNQFFVNQSTLSHRWVKLRLRGRHSTRWGVGARLRVEAETQDGTPIVRHAVIGNTTGFGSAPYLAHVGLMDAERIRHVDVFWPASRCRVRYASVPLDASTTLDEAHCSTQSSPPEGLP